MIYLHHCGRPIQAADTMRGKAVACPFCKAAIPIPGDEPITVPAVGPVRKQVNEFVKSVPHFRPLVILGMVGVLFGLVLLISHWNMETSVESGFGRVHNLSLAHKQLMGVVGGIALTFAGAVSWGLGAWLHRRK